MKPITLEYLLEHIVHNWYVMTCDCEGHDSVYCFYCGAEQEHVKRDYSTLPPKIKINPESHKDNCLYVRAKAQQRKTPG